MYEGIHVVDVFVWFARYNTDTLRIGTDKFIFHEIWAFLLANDVMTHTVYNCSELCLMS